MMENFNKFKTIFWISAVPIVIYFTYILQILSYSFLQKIELLQYIGGYKKCDF